MKCGFSWILVWCTLITAKISAQTDSLVWEAWQAVNDNYYDTAFHGTDWKKISAKYLTSGKNSRQTIQAMLSELRDPAIRLLTADQFNRFLTEVTGAEHEGIGLMELLSIDVDVKGNIVIVTPIPGTPAAEAGLQPLDKLTEINGQSVSNLQLQDVMDRLRVKKGQKLSLTIERSGKKLQLNVTGALIHAQTQYVSSKELPDAGYIRIESFGNGSAQQFKEALEKFISKKGIIIDVRNNPGGLLTEVSAMCGYLLGHTTIGWMESRGSMDSLTAASEQIYTGKISVLINHGTASAAELMAGAINDHARGRLFGQPSIGKGLVHNFIPLPDGSVLVMSIGKLHTPNGTDILTNGIIPSVKNSNGDWGAPIAAAHYWMNGK